MDTCHVCNKELQPPEIAQDFRTDCEVCGKLTCEKCWEIRWKEAPGQADEIMPTCQKCVEQEAK